MRVPIIDVDTLSRNWWLVVLRGVLGIAFGIITFVAPAISLAALVLLFGAYAFADGVFAIASAVRRRGTTDRWWVLLLEGLVGIGAGLVTLFLPGITAIVLLYIIAGWAVATGILELVAAVRLRKEIEHEWLLALSGIASVVFGVLIALFPGAGALALVIWIGAYAFVFGALLVALGFRLRGMGRPRTAREVPGMA
ncbi:MAG TPA: HdeD family acid-resistance protein [Gemmatimonadales bacterium]|jgi:uncharacterized membrane protein HdeD (DUF308 family)